MKTPVVYGIPNCETVKRSRAWLDTGKREYVFHDYKKQGVPAARLDAWLKRLGWEALVNRKGTTWRKLGPKKQAAVKDAASARALTLEQPSVIRRPVVEWPDGSITVGFEPDDWAGRR